MPFRDRGDLTLLDEELADHDFSGAKLGSLTVGESHLTRCRFERMRVEDACFGTGLLPSTYTDCSFDGSRVAGDGWGRARFVRCSFRGVRLKGLFGFDAEFVDCVFTGRAESVVFHGSPINGLDAAREHAELVADLLDRQTLPDGKAYALVRDARAAVVAAREQVRFWDDEAAREYALAVLRNLMRDVEDGQEQFLLRPSDWRHDDADRELLRLLT